MKRLLPIIASGFLWSCGGGGIQIPNCFKDGCPPGKECREVAVGIGLCFDVTGTATPVATPAGTATHVSTNTPTPQATATPQSTPTQQAPTATPQATATPCSQRTEKVCLKDGREYPLAECWTCRAQIPGVMNLTDYWAGSYWTPGDPVEDSDARTDGKFPKGLWLNDNGHDQWQCVSKRTCDRVKCNDPGTVISPFAVMFPPAVTEIVRTCPTPGPTVTPQATPQATPTPGPGGCPPLLKVGGMFLSAVSCGQSCINQGYLGWRVNYTATELCREGDAGCVCDPARNRCEMPRPCQNPLGADIRITLEGKFTNDICDANSDNPNNCHTKAKADETGVTLFTSMPKGETDYYSARTVTNCVDIQKASVKQLDRNDGRCKAALAAAGR